ncbi:MAG: hypothetical protein A3C03_00155 [Candidatus Colwellbacteria bacterium RIFCSPHIGHO2_02_FULL_45_17]|nr:MAG: hypothetical protein A3C03_00155 [Candidatus Colwellbacteria bacterium RIFCSPHIGHO2_02_FULL_45_17]
MKKILIVSGIIVALGGIIFYYLISYSNKGVKVEINVPSDEVSVGVPFDVDVIFTNETGNSLGDVKITLDPSEQIVFDSSGMSNIEARELGEIKNGSTVKESFKVVALPGEEPQYKAVATVFYSPASLVAEFKKKQEAEVRVRKPDYELTLEVPEQVSSGEEFDIKLKYERDDDLPELAEFEVHVDHPSNFEVVKSKPEEIGKAIDGAKFTNLEEEEGEISLTGKVEFPDSSEFQVKARLVMKMFGEEYTFLSETKTILTKPSALSFQVVLGEHESEVKPGDELTYVLTYRNNTNVPLEDIVIKAQLLGEMFDFGALDTNGRFASTNGTITWDKNNVSELRKLDAGRDGSVSVKIKIRGKYPIQQLNDKNFSVVVDARIESPTAPNLTTGKTVNTSRVENKIAGLLEIDAGGYFRDAQSGIINGGPLPPRVGIPTNYTIHWRVTNYGTDVDKVEVRAKLGAGVKFTGKTAGNTDSAPQVDSSTGEVVWQVGRLLATTGILNEKPEAIFQVEARPSGSDVGNYMVILESTGIQGRDEFTETTIIGTDDPVTTRLSADPTVGANDGKVIQ